MPTLGGRPSLAESQAHLQQALDVVQAWGLRWRFSFWAPPNRRLWSSVLSAAAPIVPCILGTSLSFWYHNAGTSVSLLLPLSLGVLMLTWSALVVIASSTKLAPGVVAKVCLSLSPHLSSLLASFPVRHSVWSSSVTTPQHFSNSTSRPIAGAVIFLGGPCRSSSLGAWHRRCTPPCPRTCILFFVRSRVCHGPLFLSPSRPCQCLRALFHRARHMVAPVRVPFNPTSWPRWHSLGSPPSAIRHWFSREAIPRLDRDLRLRLATMASDLHGVRVDVTSDNFLPARENPVYSFNLPPSTVRLWGLARWGHDVSSTGRPSRHRLRPSSCPLCHDVDGSLAHHLSSCPAHINTRAAWAHSCGVSLSDAPALARHWVFNPFDESNTPQTTRAHIRFVGLVCERLQPLSW